MASLSISRKEVHNSLQSKRIRLIPPTRRESMGLSEMERTVAIKSKQTRRRQSSNKLMRSILETQWLGARHSGGGYTVTGSSRESTTDTQARSTDISIHLSPARRGESDSLGADSVAPTIRLHHSPKQQTFPTHITNRYRDLEVHDNLTQDLDNLTRRT